ncbi:FGGY-family carbohydrate kinase [Humibacter ginsenosidimutans]|uniref:Sugar kinase n=1 Tax=Humibacter ginsenosidimutans TaxID=2599293 RepID=A0A5B8M5C6_9MICO|nr:FGGY-family carbohydrate kinase [Humibacter ginsenosidimutans]QDZ15968.1 sugar kinase [Humibacter ginsenosidimutans]
MTRSVALGLDIGTSSSKGVLVDRDGRIMCSAVREHSVSRPRAGWAEMDASLWWAEFVAIARELLAHAGDVEVIAVGVSGMGPCLLAVDDDGAPLRPALLYGVDMRAREQIASMTHDYGGDEEIERRTGARLSTQAVGPKLRWMREEEPELFARARRMFMPSSWLVWNLTGEYVLDHHSASQCWPLYDPVAEGWLRSWASEIAGPIGLPELKWPGDIAGVVTERAAQETGLPTGIPVIAGTIDAWSEAVSVDAQNTGDLMLMYGTTMFLVNTVGRALAAPGLWGTAGAFRGTHSLAAGMATSGAITAWLRELSGGTPYPELLREAADSGPGARGLLMLPYFAGERTPIADPDARGTIFGLTVTHARGDLYRAALEATAFGVRHNVEAMVEGGGLVQRIVAVGGGVQGELWAQIVTDVLGRDQEVPTQTVGASLGAAYLATRAVDDSVSIRRWNPPRATLRPNPRVRRLYDERYALYRQAYGDTVQVTHALASVQT